MINRVYREGSGTEMLLARLRSKDECGTGNEILTEKQRQRLTNEVLRGLWKEDSGEGRDFRTVEGSSVILKHLEGFGKQLENS